MYLSSHSLYFISRNQASRAFRNYTITKKSRVSTVFFPKKFFLYRRYSIFPTKKKFTVQRRYSIFFLKIFLHLKCAGCLSTVITVNFQKTQILYHPV